MTTLDDVIQIQKQYSILVAPTIPSSAAPVSSRNSSVATVSSRTNSTLNINLQNTTSSSTVYAYITGLDINNNDAVFLLQSDGQTPYYPTSPSSTLTALAEDCSILLNGEGATVAVTIPQLAGGRIWFSLNEPLTFLLNPGPALVEPSVTNTSDPNYALSWDFCEFTFNSAELFANISYVDFVCLPIALTLTNTSGTVQTVTGMPSTGLATVCSGLEAQDAKDGAGWSQLIVSSSSGSSTLRALSPNSAITMNNSLFSNYWEPYVASVWAQYASSSLNVDTQASWGTLTASVAASTGLLTFLSDSESIGAMPQPSSADIFSCSSGAFAGYATNTAEMGNVVARVAAAFNRSTLLLDADQPDGEQPSTYYTNAVTNHYARIVHSANTDGRGYAFPYDDVGPDGGADQTGSVSDGAPQLFTVAVGGGASSAASRMRVRTVPLRDMARRGGQMPGGYRSRGVVRRGLDWSGSAEEEKARLAEADAVDESGCETVPDPVVVESYDGGAVIDLEKGASGLETGRAEATSLMKTPLRSLLPAAAVSKAEALVRALEASPALGYAKPAVVALAGVVPALLSLSVRALVSRVGVVLFLILFSVLFSLFGRPAAVEGVLVE